VLVTVLVFLSACGEETLYSGLSEREANEMIAQLQRAGIAGQKSGLGGDNYSVKVVDRHFSQAVEVLNSAGLPRKKLRNMGEVFEKEGFVSSPLEERARLNFAQTQELTETIESIDGVVLARVHLALPEEKPLEENTRLASASVFIKYREGADLVKREAQIKALLVNSVEDLPYENVTVVMFPAAVASTSNMVVIDNSSFWVEVLSGLIAVLIFAIACLVWKLYLPRNPGKLKSSKNIVGLFDSRKGA
jgi:type III secretion protein J